MKWILLLPLAAASAGAQTYVKPFSVSAAMTEKLEHKIIGPTIKKSPYELQDSVSIGFNYRTPSDRIKLGLAYSHTIQNGTDSISAEARYNLLQWGRRPVNRTELFGP